MNQQLRRIAKTIAQQTVGRIPPPASRLTGRLACDGGTPVRNTRFRPWAKYHSSNLGPWLTEVGPRFRKIFLSGQEGTPQVQAKEFAQRWAEYCGCRYGLLVSHGTDALRIALAAVLDHDGLDYGGEVIIPNFSFVASANAALDRRFGVALVDVDPETLLLDPKRVEEAIIPGRTRAVMPVHLFGQPADMTSFQVVAQKHGLKIVEDAAQAQGSEWETGRVGSLGDAAAFSFQAFKNLCCGEGGALTTNDQNIFERAHMMHDVGRPLTDAERWRHVTLGWNCRATEYQAALLSYRFGRFEAEQERRRQNFITLRELLKDTTCVKPLAIQRGVRRHGMHMFPMRYFPENCGDLSFKDFLIAAQAEGTPIYQAYNATISAQPATQKLMSKHPDFIRLLPTPVSDRAVNGVGYIPHEIFLGTEEDMADIAAALTKVQRHYGAGIKGKETRAEQAA
ncbi:MAG TPA: DegT/DnrJ/EryC1/StrS family aminotransferase [Pyrinomonadaceae bacterium]|nr:DegT/DnrJ/EryC1/StrS family aminotransferase [Pyrinomonadaceae bacterium]